MAGRTEGLWSSGVNNASSNGELSTGGCIAYTYKHKGTYAYNYLGSICTDIYIHMCKPTHLSMECFQLKFLYT